MLAFLHAKLLTRLQYCSCLGSAHAEHEFLRCQLFELSLHLVKAAIRLHLGASLRPNLVLFCRVEPVYASI